MNRRGFSAILIAAGRRFTLIAGYQIFQINLPCRVSVLSALCSIVKLGVLTYLYAAFLVRDIPQFSEWSARGRNWAVKER